ncbi:MAG: orotidine-5'-phosphate decarboxylase [Actinomycetota bacterium]
MSIKPPIILAVDTPDLDIARQWIETTSDFICAYKVGLEFFTTFGPEGVKKLQDASDVDLFLDLKLHDIPNTVAGAARGVAELAPRFLTVHASGGHAMISAAVEQAPQVEITAVTILTSLSALDLQEIGFAQNPLDSAVKLALLSQGAGARAIVCSPHEIFAIRESVGPDLTIIAPGVRPIGEGGLDDQTRTMSPRAAILAGATYLVIGRPITRHWVDGAEAMRNRAAAIVEGLG